MRPRRHVVLVVAAAAAVLAAAAPVHGQATRFSPEARHAIAPEGRLRVGVYAGSPTSMVRDARTREERGVTVDLGSELGRRLGIPVDLVEFPQIADVLAALAGSRVDFTVTNATPARAAGADFTRTVLAVELGYLAAAGSSISGREDVDRAGVRVGVTQGGSSHAALSRELRFASVVPAATLAAATAMLARGELDAYATNKAILFEMSDRLPGSRVLEGRWGVERFAIGIPKGRGDALKAVDAFAEAVVAEGLVRRAAERAGMRGLAGAE